MWAEECEPGGGVVMVEGGELGGEGVEVYSGGDGGMTDVCGEREGGGGGGVRWGVRVVVEHR